MAPEDSALLPGAMAHRAFFDEPLPELSPEAVRAATGNSEAQPKKLVEKCKEFLTWARKGGQLRHYVRALPLPMTHCTVCLRACDAANMDFAELAYEQTRPSSRLRRLTGGIFSKLCGHRPPFCCDASWHCTDVLETFARYDGSREVREAPFNPGCSPEYSHVGGSLRLLPTARLDRLTAAWQTKYGYDSKPLYEMHRAYANLKGAVVKLSPTKCTLGFCGRVSVEAEICDYSRRFSSGGGDVLCVMGRLSVHFHEGSDKSTYSLPSRMMVLAVVPACRKGSVPLINGTPAYIVRRFQARPNVAHVIKNAKDDLECTILCQSEHGGRRSFFVAARLRAPQESAEARGGNKACKKMELHFFVRAPRAETTQDAEKAENLQRSAAGKGAAKDAPELVPLMPWLLWLLRCYDETASMEAVQEELAQRVKTALQVELGREPPENFVEQTMAVQTTSSRSYAPKSKRVKTGSFLLHVADDPDCKLGVLSQLLAKALAVYLMQRPADTIPSTKSMNSPSDIWQGLLREAVRKALSAALKKSLGVLERKVQDAEGAIQRQVVYHEYGGEFQPPNNELLKKCCRFNDEGGRVCPRTRAAVVDAFAEHHCTGTTESESGADSFHWLHDRTCGWLQNTRVCPLCQATGAGAQCRHCKFERLNHVGDLDLYCFKPSCKPLQAPSSEDVWLQKIYFALGVAHHVASDGVARRFLCKALKGKDEEEEDKPQVGSIVAAGTENSSKGTNSKRGENLPTELHENLIDGRAGKDSNPDLRVYLLTGTSIQPRPSPAELSTMLACILASAPWKKEAGEGRLEVRDTTLLTFDPEEVCTVLQDVRTAVHKAAMDCGNEELAMCCPVLRYGASGPVVTLLCSGREQVRAVGWRNFTAAETAALDAVAAGLPFPDEKLHESWHGLGETGLKWEMLVYAGIVTYCAADRHLVLKEDEVDFSASTPDGLTFYKISAELESSIRVLQTEDAATWQAGHAVRQGYSVGMALNAHKSEPLSHSKGSISSIRSVGCDPCKGNMRNLVGSAPDNYYASTLKLNALLHNFGTIMQEDSMPESADAFRHLTLRNQSICFTARASWVDGVHSKGHKRELSLHVQGKNYPKDVDACLSDETGLVKKPFTFVKRGQALCFVIGGGEPEEGRKPGNLLKVAPCDMWVKAIHART